MSDDNDLIREWFEKLLPTRLPEVSWVIYRT